MKKIGRKIRSFLLLYNAEVFIVSLGISFSFFLFWKTFWINDGYMYIAGKVWSDFSATIPLTRSFSFGDNFPPEYPLFAGPPIRYHFLYYLLIGNLEKVGVRLDVALNSLSTISFIFLLYMIYLVGKNIFDKKSVGILSVVLFLFNGSFGFLAYFEKHGIQGLYEVFSNTAFSSFGPYDGGIVSAFWSLNIFTNQRHLAFSYASYLLFIYLLIKWRRIPNQMSLVKASLLGLFIGIFPFTHMVVFLMMGITLIVFFLFSKSIRWKTFLVGSIALLIAFPQIVYMGSSEIETKLINPGYLAGKNIFWFIQYWFYNLGFLSLLLPLAFLKSKFNQLFFIFPFIIFFIIGNIFQFSPEIAANHKFFNMFLIGANMFIASFLVLVWNKHLIGKFLFIPIFLLLTLSGFIDIFPIINDNPIKLADISKNSTAQFIIENTPKDAVFLNSTYLFDPASLAGRKVYLGWPYFAWSAGYNTTERNLKMKRILAGEDISTTCLLLKSDDISYVLIENPTTLEEVEVDYEFWRSNFSQLFYSENQNIFLYDVHKSCI